LLAEQKSNKDASTETILNLIRLEDRLANCLGLTATEGTLAVVAIPAGTTTTLSVTFASASVVRPISTDDYEIVHVDDQRGGGMEGQIRGNNVDPFPSVDDVDLNLQ
ncbi:hypothetical protein Tco_1062980, partial [Tanacetum coccineum]